MKNLRRRGRQAGRQSDDLLKENKWLFQGGPQPQGAEEADFLAKCSADTCYHYTRPTLRDHFMKVQKSEACACAASTREERLLLCIKAYLAAPTA